MKCLSLILLSLALSAAPALSQGDVWTLIPNTTGSLGRPVNAILPDPRAPDTLYIGTDTGILKVRASTGDTSAAGFGTRLPGQGIFALVAHPRNPSVLYAGTSGDGVYRTTDGMTWAKLPGQPAAMNTIHAIAVDPRDTTILYAGTLASGLFRSTNSGVSWSAFNRRDATYTGGVPDSLSNVYFILPHPSSPDTVVFAGTLTNGVFRNRGGRASWIPASNGLPTGLSATLRGLLSNPADGNVLYAGVASRGFYKTTDGGTTWVKKRGGISDTTDVRSLAQAPSFPTFLYAGTFTQAMFRSGVGAEIWDPIASLPVGLSAQAVAVDPIRVNRVYAGTFNGVYRLDVTSVPQVTYAVGSGPAAVVAANLDTSALVDLAVANSADNTVSVLLNRVGGVLLRRDIPVGGDPRSLAVADVDGDGKRDLIVGARAGKGVTILRNDGSGGFAFFLDLFAGRTVEAVAAADFDGDGDVDVATANGSENTISVFLNGGRGTFLPAREQALRVGPRSIALADFNRDGRPDLAAADPAGDAVSILINRGEGLFFPDFPVSVPGGPTSAVAGDFNLDGANDFAVAAPGRSAVALVYGNGDGTFQSPVYSLFPEPPSALAVADLDGDRYSDLVVGFRTAVASFLNDGSGRLVGGSVFGVISGVSGVAAADYDGDGRPDAVVLSSEAGAVVLYRNTLPLSIKRPAPPRNLRASDTPADLGGRVTLTWQQPRADEETGRVVAYDIFRSGARDGTYTRIASVGVSAPFLSRDSTLITRVTVDSTATVGVPFFYYITAKDAFGSASVPSAVVTATSVAQPVFNFDFSNTGLYSVGDTVTIRVSLNPLGYRLRGLSLFLDYHPRALALVDAEAGPGVQPFALNPALPPGDVLENRLAGEGKINLSVGSLTSDQGLALEIGTLRFVALRDTVAALSISSDAAGNRRTALIDASDGSALSPNLPPQPASVVIRNYRVNGSVRFQGRSANLDLQAQIDLRQPNGLPLSTPYAPANDQDKNREGVQLTLDRGGGFSLIQVPAGRYAVFAKAFHYLRGRVTGDSITVGPGAPAAPLTFRWVSSGGTVHTELRGGDANNDNNVNLTDFGLLARHFGSFNVADPQNPAWVADFNGDGRVNLDDFSILSSNFGEQGFGQGISTKPASPAARLHVVRSPEGGEEVFRISVEGVPHRMDSPLRVWGFSADLVYSAEGGGMSGLPSDVLLSEGGAAQAQGVRMWWIVRPLGRGLRVAGYVKGDPIQAEGAAEVALLYLGLRRGLPAVQNAWVADREGEALPALAEAVDAPPRRPALLQNVPNPFNPATEIAYEVPEGEGAEARVILRVYNLTGQVVRRLVDAPHAPGRYRVTWDGRDDLGHPVASGVYFYEMEVGTFRDAKRMLLLR